VPRFPDIHQMVGRFEHRFPVIAFLAIFAAPNENAGVIAGSFAPGMLANSFTSLALSELLGGVVAFLTKNECYSVEAQGVSEGAND
jgi:hypothetical protein